MQIQFTGHHLEVTAALREFTMEKLERIKRHYADILSINITFLIEKLNHVVKASIHIPGDDLHASAESEVDMYAAVDTLVDKLDRILKKHKG